MRRTALILCCVFCIVMAWTGLGASPQSRLNVTAVTVASNAPVFTHLHGRAGYWRLGEDSHGVWWFISPAGQKEFLNLVTTVQPFQLSRSNDGPDFTSTDYKKSLSEPDRLDHWAAATIARVRSVGFKGIGAWSNPVLHNYDIPMSQDLNVWGWIDPEYKRFYSPQWAVIANRAIRSQVVRLRYNRNLIGYYIDNELDWGDGFSGVSAYFDSLSPADPNRQQVMQVIHDLWPTVSSFDAAWKLPLHSWKDLDSLAALPREPFGAYEQLESAWMSHLASDYFRLTTSLIREYDPNHLILGVRFKGLAQPEVVTASRDYTDAQSINYYPADAKLDMAMFTMMYRQSLQPIIISEYSFHALDGTSGNRDVVGFCGAVPDQQARADGYRLFTKRLAKVPYIVGADWFQWSDEPPAGRADGEDVNFGIVDVHDHPYPLLVKAIGQTTPLLDPAHALSFNIAQQADVWRESFASLPVMHVPYLNDPPKLDGMLNEWPAAARLAHVRFSQTVGINRVKQPLPNIYLGWTRSAIYLGAEVFDKHLTVTPADGWWWTRDNLEFWISTRPVASDQTEYNVYCHHFFYVPDASTGGTVGQWHRDGDDLTDNMIPDPLIRQTTRIYPDRYIVEMMIPTAALHGYDPIKQPAMAFNVHVHDYELATDAFWSAPKEAATQLRPNTWGTLYLDPPSVAMARQ
ncbi:MAG TPA: sugar-binding protein [Tepidisphaeraceae bacterium]|nr:sugar-binding protein [Tepidisphaeraceae bacterium]